MMNRKELETQLQAFFDGTLEEEEFAALQQLLRADPNARECYRDYLHLHHVLSFRAKGAELAMPAAIPVGIGTRGLKQHDFPKRRLLAAAAILMFAAIGGGLFVWNHSKKPPLRFTAGPGTAIHVTPEIPKEGGSTKGSFLEPGSRLEIGDGSLELQFTSGVRGIVRGPASLTLLRKDLVELEHGTAWFQVPQKAAGFKVSTPDLILNDAGAEFGVISDPSFPAEVHVFDGSIEVTNRHGRKYSTWVKAGNAQAAEDSGEWQQIPVRRLPFLTSLPTVEVESNLIVSKEFSEVQFAYVKEASPDDLLSGIVPRTEGWKLENEADPLELTDGIHGLGFEQVPGDKVQGSWTTVGATAEYQLGKGPHGTGYNINSIRSIADWVNVGFGNQAWTMEVKPVGSEWRTLVSVAYEPLNAQPLTGGGATKVAVTAKNGRLAQGIEAIKVTAGRVPGSVDHAFVWRELDVFGGPSDKVPPP